MDSANILSILATLGKTQDTQGILPVTFTPLPVQDAATAIGQSNPPAPVTNVLQAAMTPPPAAVPAPQPAAKTPPVPVDHPRKRQSVIDVIGRLADVVARVGGAEALYQPTLDAREDRARSIDLEDLKKRLTVAEVGEAELNPILAARKRLGTALGALANNPDAASLWPSVAEQAGITDPQQVAGIGAILQAHPTSAGIFAKALGADVDNLGKNVYFGTDTNGKTVAYQVGPDGTPHILDFSAAGVTPSDPIKVVDTGGSSVVIGSGGQTKKILPKTVSPDQRDRSQTAITIAGMPARSKGDGKTAPGGDDGNVPQLLDNIQRGFNDLHNMKALPGEGTALDQIEGGISRSSFGQKVGEQFGTPSAQKRLEIMKNVSALQQAMLKSLPASATRTTVRARNARPRFAGSCRK
jgi:hypothetical protein